MVVKYLWEENGYFVALDNANSSIIKLLLKKIFSYARSRNDGLEIDLRA